MMKFVILSCVALSLASANTRDWSKLRIKFGPLGIVSKVLNHAYWEVPSHINEANESGWLTITNDNELSLQAVAWQGDDHRIVPLYDANGWLAGLQLAASKEEIDAAAPPYFDASLISVYEVKKVLNVLCYTSTLYLVDIPTLKSGGRTSSLPLGDGLWFKTGSSYAKVLDDESGLLKEGLYTKQNCIPFMGTHYYYNMTENMDLKTSQPFFLLVNDGSINGLGWQMLGKSSHGQRNWWDSINKLAVRLTVPYAPKELAEDVEKYGITSVHIYLKDKPWTITCL